MRASALMAGLYPPAVRERWGAEISRQVAETGIRSWPDTIAGAVRLWFHPSDWPETFAGQTRRVLAVALFAITGVTALLLRATQPSAVFTADLRHPAASVWLALILLGIGLATPLPPLRRATLQRLATVVIRTLTVPALAILVMYLTAHSGLVDHPSGPARAALIVYYWATLAFIALRLCTFIARIARTAATPSTCRVCAALLLIGAGLALAASQSLLTITRIPGAGPIAVTITLGALAAATISAGYDLYGTTTRSRR